MRTTQYLTMALAVTVAAASGCGKGSDMASVSLDHPATVKATGAQPQSQVTLYRENVNDSTRTLSTVQIRDAALEVYAGGDGAVIKELTLSLADADMAATSTMPGGVRLRNQKLTLSPWLPSTVTQREPNALAVQGKGAFTYTADLINDDGSVSKVGPVATEEAELDVHATRYEFGVKITVDTAPNGKCWSVPGVLEVGNCSLFVDMDGVATNP